MIVGFGTIRAIYRDQQELIRLDQEAREVTHELDRLREENAVEIDALRKQVDRSQSQRDEAIHQRQRLRDEIDGIEREYQTLIKAVPETAGDVAGDGAIRDAAARRSRAQQALASYNEKVTEYERGLAEARSELAAAEQLLNEVETRREDLTGKLRDRNREILKLKSLIQNAQRQTHTMQLERMRIGAGHARDIRAWQESQDAIEEQLGRWVKTGSGVRVNFSDHSKAGIVEQQLARIDAAFVERYFTHVTNQEYTRGARRLIRVMTGGGDDPSSRAGELMVALDDDAGRTLGMRFETRRDAPEASYVGFVLALLLRTKCRDFRGFAVRAR
jgi:DNA repair exonuclease SbcCD ATPase subunit